MGEVTQLPGRAEAALSAPVPINASQHDLTRFQCRHEALNDWLKIRAIKAEGASARTYVVCSGSQVVGYYSLVNGGVERDKAPSNLRRNMPDPVPAMLLGRLATDVSFERQGIGGGLLKDALLRTLQASKIAGLRALMVHAIDDDARAFYLARGFSEFPTDSRTLFLSIETIVKALV